MDIKKFSFDGVETEGMCVSVYDGDTAQFVFQTPQLTAPFRFSCRMMGYNSAEMKSSDEEEKKIAHEAQKVLSDLILNKQCHMSLGPFDKYGRVLATVTVSDVNGASINVNEFMVSSGHGKPYSGHGDKLY